MSGKGDVMLHIRLQRSFRCAVIRAGLLNHAPS